MNYKESILNKIETNQEVVGVIGLGYVGLPLAVSFAEVGVKVIGFDKDANKVNKINHGDNYIKDIEIVKESLSSFIGVALYSFK